MKKIFLAFLIAALIPGLLACHKPEPAPLPTPQPEIKDYLEFHEEAEEMSVGSAQEYLQDPDADPAAAQYKEAVFTVNKAVASSIITEARESGVQGEKVQALFNELAFRFIDGDRFASQTVDQKIFIRGTYALGEDGWYYFTFYDRTLVENAVKLQNDHALDAYNEVLELLLSDPNVIVKTI